MFNLHHVRAQLDHPDNPAAASVFRELLQALEKGSPFDLSHLDNLSYAEFEMAVESIREWRSLRYVEPNDPVYSFPLHE
jgi:hypothetical protein